MGLKNADHVRKEQARRTINLSGVSGSYGDGFITFGFAPSGQIEQSFSSITALIEGDLPAGASVELWLPRVTDGSEAASQRDPSADYFYSGQSVYPARTAATPAGVTVSFGSGTWSLAGYPGAQIRVRDGGTAGAATISASAL